MAPKRTKYLTKPKRVRLLEAAELAEKEALSHPRPDLLEDYSLNPAVKLTQNEVELIKTHVAICRRCRIQVEDTQSRADYFRRLKRKDYCN